MRDDDFRDLLTRYAAEPGGPAPSASTLRARAGRRRAALLGAGGLATAVALAGAAILLPPALRGPAPYATPANPSTGVASPAPSSCRDVATAWAQALTTPVPLPAALGANPRLTSSPDGATLVAMGQLDGQYVPAVFPAGLDGPMVRLLPDKGERVTVLAVSGSRVVFRVAAPGTQKISEAEWRIVVLDGPDAAPRTLAAVPRDKDLARGYDLSGHEYRIVNDRLRWFETVVERENRLRLFVAELALDASPSTQPTRRDLGAVAVGSMIVTDSRVLVPRPDGSWQAYAAADLSSLARPRLPRALTDANAEVHILRPIGDRVTYTAGAREDPVAWEYDVVTGENRRLMAGAWWASAYGDLAVGLGSVDGGTGWRLRDLATGNEVTLPLLKGYPHLIRLGDSVTNVPQHGEPDREPAAPDPPDSFTGALVPIASLPRTIPAC